MQEAQETWVWFLSREDALEEGMATHSNTLAWRIPWTEEPGRGVPSVALQRVGQDWSDNICTGCGYPGHFWDLEIMLTLRTFFCGISDQIYTLGIWESEERGFGSNQSSTHPRLLRCPTPRQLHFHCQSLSGNFLHSFMYSVQTGGARVLGI